MQPNLQPTLQNDSVALVPLEPADFEQLYLTAADEKIWEQHPNKDRWRKEVFQGFFEGAIKSGGAFKIIDKKTGQIAGSTRFYDYNETEKSIYIGYTFYATRYWGSGLNPSVKQLMQDYIFQYVDKVLYQIGAENIRSQVAITRLGAQKIGEENGTYYYELSHKKEETSVSPFL